LTFGLQELNYGDPFKVELLVTTCQLWTWW